MPRYQIGNEPIPGYTLLKFLGEGGFGEVWKARSPGGGQVALKAIHLGTKQGEREFRALKLVKQVQQAGLTPIFAFWLRDSAGNVLDDTADPADVNRTTLVVSTDSVRLPSELIIAMGLGHANLLDRLRECQAQGLTAIPEKELLQHMFDAARALDFMNQPPNELVHGDIKPQNILVVGNATWVCDFGLAKPVEDPHVTSIATSIAYAAPEILDQKPPHRNTDQYSLALSYIELRTGKLPFKERASMLEIWTAHLHSNLDLSRLAESERRVVERATSRDPEARYPSAVEFVEALTAAVSPSSITSPQPGWKLRAALATLAAIAVIAVAALLGQSPIPSITLPPDFVADASAGEEVFDERRYPKRIVCQRFGLEIPFRLIPRRVPQDPETFYLMENKVTNAQFDAFAAKAADSRIDWSGRSNDSTGELPCLGVKYGDAWQFAAAAGGRLPSAKEWDKAAGCFDHSNDQLGPFLGSWNPEKPRTISVRGESPTKAGSFADDVSSFGCRDMAGNGLEWTSTCDNKDLDAWTKDPDDPRTLVELRGKSYAADEPWYFSDANENSPERQSQPYDKLSPHIGFRVAVRPVRNED